MTHNTRKFFKRYPWKTYLRKCKSNWKQGIFNLFESDAFRFLQRLLRNRSSRRQPLHNCWIIFQNLFTANIRFRWTTFQTSGQIYFVKIRRWKSAIRSRFANTLFPGFLNDALFLIFGGFFSRISKIGVLLEIGRFSSSWALTIFSSRAIGRAVAPMSTAYNVKIRSRIYL